MQALTHLQQLRTALDRELTPGAIEGYTDNELEQLHTEIRQLDRYIKRIEAVLCRRELAVFDSDIDFLAGGRRA